MKRTGIWIATIAMALMAFSCAGPTTSLDKSVASSPRAAATTTGDFREESIYFLIPTRFIDGDPSNNVPNEWCSFGPNSPLITDPKDVTWRGDFRGLITTGLAYIKDLGFTSVWLTPIVQNRGPLDYHGYHAWDLNVVDARLETPGYTYQDFINKAHSLGLKVIQDVVWNHSGRYGLKTVAELKYNTDPTQPWGKDKSGLPLKNNAAWSYDGKTPNPDDGKIWSRANLATMPAPYNANLALYNWPSTQSFLDTSDLSWFHHSGNGFAQGWDDTTNLYERAMADDCPDLNTESQLVRDYEVAAYKKYIDMGVDAFRVDTVKHMDRASVLWFVNQFKAYKPDLFIFGEVAQLRHELHPVESINPHWYTWTGAVKASSNSGLAVLDFFAEATFHGVFESDGNLSDVTQAARYDDLYSDPSTNVMWLDNHDFGPNNDWNRRYSGDADGLATYMNFTWTWRGIPSWYYGDEIQFQKGLLADIKGEPMTKTSLDLTGRAYYGDQIAAAPTNKLYQHLQKINAIRKAVPALQKGSWAWGGNASSANGVGYTRSYNGVTVAVGLAKNSTVAFHFTGLPAGTYVDAVTGTRVVSNGTLDFSASTGSAGIYVLGGPGIVGALGAGFFQTTSDGGGGGGGTGWTECFLRGTNNAWGATAMTKNPGTGLWETNATFDANSPRFKISHFAGNWNEAFPAADRLITEGAGDYSITFDEVSKGITVVKKITITSSISGVVSSAAGPLAGVSVSTGSLAATTDSAGSYTLSGLGAGTYTLTPTLAGYSFSPTSRTVAVATSNVTGQSFTGTKTGAFAWATAFFRGTSNAWGSTPMVQNATTGLWEVTQTFDANNPRFKISHFNDWTEAYPAADRLVTEGAGTYKITFNDGNKAIVVTKVSTPTFSISGTITAGGLPLSGASVSSGTANATTDASGAFSLNGLAAGTYTLIAAKAGYAMSPSSLSVTVVASSVGSSNFTATPSAGLVVHFAEFESETGYTLHAWNGLTADLAMSYEGLINGRHWWKVSVTNPPPSFLFCFVNSNGKWDGANRSYAGQASEVYVVPNSTTVATTRP